MKLQSKPSLFIICGHVGAGKTTTANKLGKMINAPVASVDTTLKRLLPDASFIGRDQPPTADELKLCYNAFAFLADYILKAGNSIIIDGAFAKRTQRQLLISTAKKHKAAYHVLYIHCPEELLHERASNRFLKGKGVGWQAHLQIKKIYEPLTIPYYTIDTSKNVDGQLRKFIKSL